MKYNLVIFDLDNTLLDFDKMELGSLKQILNKYNLEANDEIIKTYKAINKGLWEQLEDGNYTKAEILELRFKRFFDKYDFNACPSSFNKDYLNEMSNHIYLTDFTEEVLDHYKNRTELVIMTNGVTIAQKMKMKKSGLDKYFDLVVISDEVGYHKPNTKIFEYLEKQIGSVDKEKTIIIGDSLSSDIKGGINFGIDTCWYNPKSVSNKLHLEPKFEIKSLEELYEIL